VTARRRIGSQWPAECKGYFDTVAKERRNLEIEETKNRTADQAQRNLAGQPMTREQALAMRGAHAIGEVPADSGPGGVA
jgi:hypothetical protein